MGSKAPNPCPHPPSQGGTSSPAPPPIPKKRVTFVFDERSLVPVQEIEARGGKMTHVKVGDREILLPSSPPPSTTPDVQALQAAALMAADYFDQSIGNGAFYQKHPDFRPAHWSEEIAELARILRAAAGVKP